jgi:hypothetical protein
VADLGEKLDKAIEENACLQSELEEARSRTEELIQRLKEEISGTPPPAPSVSCVRVRVHRVCIVWRVCVCVSCVPSSCAPLVYRG